MIYVTGDLCGDTKRIKSAIKHLKKQDTLIVCGEFGLFGTAKKREQRFIKKTGRKAHNILFVGDEKSELCNGNNPTTWNGGKTHIISGNIRQLLQGEVFAIEGKRFFIFGGADKPNQNQVQPRKMQKFRETVKKLESIDSKVDFIITYDAPSLLLGKVAAKAQAGYTNMFLSSVADHCNFAMWFFGKYHIDKRISINYRAIFKDIIKLH